jgi:glycosyltransferase involved in cell wall biosynthesis
MIVVIPANHTISAERIAERMPVALQGEVDVIVACAGQPAVITGIHTHLRNAQFLLAPVDTSVEDLRVLAFEQAAGDIVTLVSGTPAGAEPDAARQSAPLPLSIIVPVRNGGQLLDDTLAAILASNVPRESYELIVVDDASTDQSATIAARYADTLVRLEGFARGPAYARNRGAEEAHGTVLAFIDADVRVRRDTLLRMLAALADDSGVAAVGATNDGTSGDGGVATQDWNLLQQYASQRFGGFGEHFNASCGAVRHDAFMKAGMFNVWMFTSPSLEDLELGQRLNRSGHLVYVSQDLPVSHLGRTGVRNVLRAAWRRSSLFMRSLQYEGTKPLARSHIVHAVGGMPGFFALASAALIVLSIARDDRRFAFGAATAFAILVVLDFGMNRFFVQRRSFPFMIAAGPLHVATQIAATAGRCAGWLLRHLIGDPAPDATTQAFAEVGTQLWPPIPRKR